MRRRSRWSPRRYHTSTTGPLLPLLLCRFIGHLARYFLFISVQTPVRASGVSGDFREGMSSALPVYCFGNEGLRSWLRHLWMDVWAVC